MNKLIPSLFACALCFSLSACSTQNATADKSAFILVNDDSGVLSEPERASQLKLLMLAQLKDLHTKRKFATAKLQIVSTSFGRSVWVGSVDDLKSERAEDVIQKIESNASYCNRLGESFSAVQTSVAQLEQQGYTDIHVYYFSSLISTPMGCTNDVKITLPQLPVPVDFTGTLTASNSVSSIGFYYVNPHQLRTYREVLAPVAAWANANGKDFAMYEMEDTEFHLRRGLLGVK